MAIEGDLWVVDLEVTIEQNRVEIRRLQQRLHQLRDRLAHAAPEYDRLILVKSRLRGIQ